MEGLETPYEIEVPIDFIDCVSCVKSIRSETLYKIHLTTIGHMKKEEALAANGFAVRNHIVPDFEDIMQYLQYLNLDEPIIGLSHLEEVIGSDANDPQPGPRYNCRLCSLEANLPNMINHIIGRKHRQKYLMTQRKDLVTWDPSTSFNQPAKVIRAKSEVVERQDGRGTPRPLRRNEGKSNITRGPQKQRHKKAPQNAGHLVPRYPGPEGQPGHYPQHQEQPPPFHPDDRYLGPEEEGRGLQHRRKPRRSPEQEGYSANDHDRQEFMDSDYHRDPMGVGYRDHPIPHAEGRPMHGFAEEMPHREASPYRRPHPESDPLKQFYTEELRRERARANDAAATDRMTYPSPDLQDRHPGGAGARTYAYPPGGAERHRPGGTPQGPRYPPEAPGPHESSYFNDEMRRGTPAPEESYQDGHGHRAQGYPDQDRHGDPEPRRNADQLLERDYLFEMVGALRNKGSDPYQMPPEGGRGMSEIPETFRRFLQGNASSQEARKKKSRFSDATQEEMEGSKRMLMESDRYMTFEEPGPSRQGSRERHEAHGSQRPDPYTQSQSLYQNESYPEREVENAKDGGKVFDLLKNIEIENGEEADFLKSRLCNLLKEFQAKKSEKTMQNRPDSAPVSRDYNHRSEAPRAPSPPRPEPGREAFREGMQRRPMETHPRAMETHPRSSQDPRGWKEEEQEQGGPSDERFQERPLPVHSDANVSSRQRYEEVFGVVGQHRAPDSPQPEGPARPRDGFQDRGDGFQDRGDSFQDRGDGFQDRGDRFQEQGGHFQERGERFQEQGGHFQDRGERFQEQGDCFQERGERFQEQGGRFQERGDGFQEQGGRFQEQGGHFQERGERFQEQGGRFQEQGGRFQEQGGRFQEQGGRFQERGDRCEHPSASPEFLGGRLASPSSHREQGYRRPRSQQHSSLDKITSTLLELVARK
ncbi:uncharacterized protein si:ch211-13c6.2 isoform X1 [Gadus macrocephalus]|uniref:uncharacterized protein si:ch211-13c6.2 isoform X1 n=2 Tax=Gadus macrocephalus TaxID=80720 RepID=UPI0028CB4F27|nr:uncharacterized protein si:ch211-13c6.2 isoform X1 [Gadus macrocephalus]